MQREEFESGYEILEVLPIAEQAGFYQLYSNPNTENYSVTLNLEDADTGEVYDRGLFTDMIME